MNKEGKVVEKDKRQTAFKAPPKHDTEQLINYVILFYFIIFIGLIQIFKQLDLTIFHFFRLLIIMIGVAFFIPISLYRKRWRLSYYLYTIFNIIFSGPLLLLFIFILNISFTSKPYIEEHKIIRMEASPAKNHTMIILENNQYEDKSYLRKVSKDDNIGFLSRAKKLKIEFSDGLFGICIIKERKVE